MVIPCPRCGMPTTLSIGLDGPERWCWTHGTVTETREPTAADAPTGSRATTTRAPRQAEPDGVLRRCRRCGMEARTDDDLERFSRHPTAVHGRRNLCVPCHRARSVESSRRGARNA